MKNLESLGFNITNSNHIKFLLNGTQLSYLATTVVISKRIQNEILDRLSSESEKAEKEKLGHERSDNVVSQEKVEELHFRAEGDQIQKIFDDTMLVFIKNIENLPESTDGEMDIEDAMEEIYKLMSESIVVFDDEIIDNLSAPNEVMEVVNTAISKISSYKRVHDPDSMANYKADESGRETLKFKLKGDKLHEKVYQALLERLSK